MGCVMNSTPGTPYYFTGEETTALESKKLVEVTKQRDTSPRGV